MRRIFILIGLLSCVVGCGSPEVPAPDGGSGDAATDLGPVETDAGPGRTDAGTDAGPACTDDGACDDGLFCNGAERCTDAGCAAGTPPCAAAMCDERTDTCSCLMPDADGDGVNSVACGGGDCDDDNGAIYPGNVERCDVANVDEDCDPATFGFRDADGDDFPDARCCNGTNCGSDCNDTRPGVNPSSLEVCNGVDDDCNGTADEGVLRTFYVDADGDAFGVDAADTNMQACFAPAGYADVAGDCDDTTGAVNPGAADVCDSASVDDDCNGMPNDPPAGCLCTGAESRSCTALGACAAGTESCESGAWGACSIDAVAETCNGQDEDCDGVIDDGTQITCFADGDGDGYPTMGATATLLCPAAGGFGGCPTGFTTRAPMGSTIDCDDTTFATSPVGVETCNGIDDDCDGAVDESLRVTCFRDLDNDTYSAAGAVSSSECADPSRTMVGLCPLGFTQRAPAMADCDDNDPGRSPAALEVCDGVDQNCDGTIDETVSVSCFADADNDGYAASGATSSRQCRDVSRVALGECPISFTNRVPTASSFDCVPTNAAINPAAVETCSLPAVDEDCDGTANPSSVCACGDGMVRACTLPGVCATGTEQCASGAWGACSIAPRTETNCDGLDEDCDGSVDEGLTVACYADADNDTYAAAGASPSLQCPVSGRAAVGGCPLGATNRAPGAGTSDCNDMAAGISPMGVEVCSDSGTAVDEDCDGSVDEGLRVSCYADGDGDTYALATATAASRCRDGTRGSVGFCPAGSTNRVPAAGAADCADGAADVNPGATEVCDRVDSNCSTGGGTALDEDADGDGRAALAAPCSGGFARDDCRDDLASVYPGALETCDRFDSNCSSGGGDAPDEDSDNDRHTAIGATSCSGGFPKDDCRDNNSNVYTGQSAFFSVPHCPNPFDTPVYCAGSTWRCGSCTWCTTCAPTDLASFDYDCSGAETRQFQQTCSTDAGLTCNLFSMPPRPCRSGPEALTAACGRPATYRSCGCSGPAGIGGSCVAGAMTTANMACR
jgi:hypothetical protein